MFGLMHALPPIFSAMMGAQNSTIYLVAVVTALFAVITGSLAYVVIDLIGLAIGLNVAIKLKKT